MAPADPGKSPPLEPHRSIADSGFLPHYRGLFVKDDTFARSVGTEIRSRQLLGFMEEEMPVPFSQMWTIATYVLGKKLRGVKRYPLVLMLEPLFRCNLACAGCGKIQYPTETLRKHLTPQQCFDAVDECGAPVVTIPGGEPLLHPDIHEIVTGIVGRKKYVYLCTNALLLEKHLDRFQPSPYLTFSVHLDGPKHEHDFAVCRDGVYDIAVRAIKSALAKGFRVTTNATIFNNADPQVMQGFFDTLMDLGVEGIMVSPGYPYEKAPGQELFLHRNQTTQLFRELLERPSRRWKFNLSPLFLEFLRGEWELECTPWGSPTYNLFGWQRPCYLLQEGYATSYRELLETTDWSNYGRASGNPKCSDCMMHCGYEPTAVAETFGSLRGMLRAARVTLFGLRPLPASTARTKSAPAVSGGPLPVVQLTWPTPSGSGVAAPASDVQASPAVAVAAGSVGIPGDDPVGHGVDPVHAAAANELVEASLSQAAERHSHIPASGVAADADVVPAR